MVANVTRKAFSAKSDKDATDSIPLVIEVDWTGMTLEATRDLAIKDIVIRVQGPLRKKLKDAKPGQVFKVSAVNYSTTTVDPLTMLRAMNPEERKAYLEANDLI